MNTTTLALDIETYSPQDLTKVGVYRYAEDPDFTILMLAFALEDEPVQIYDLTAEPLDKAMQKLLTDDRVTKTAYNANFERVCLSRYFGVEMPPEQWRCTAVHAATLGLPRSLADAAKALGLPQDKQKMTAGRALIRYFSMPCKPTKSNGGRERNLPHHDPDKWSLFMEYCKQDVEVERAIRKKCEKFPVPEEEQRLWCLDQKINDHGVLVDRRLVQSAIQIDQQVREELEAEAVRLTGLDNPNSVAQLKGWIEEAEGVEIDSLNKAALKDLKADTDCDTVARVLSIRQELGKTSVSKYQAMARAVCGDGRLKGLFLFHGAKTARWTSKIVQFQNLPQNKLADLDLARSLVRSGDREAVEMLYGNVSDTLSQLIRTALIPPEGKTFLVADFSAIEARVIAWLAGEQWRLDVFQTHGKIYEASASQMFGVPLEEIHKGHPLRQKGKISELALGYGGSVGALEVMGALNMGLEKEELPGLVKTWRAANPAITDLWWSVDRAAMTAVRERTKQETHGITFQVESGILFVTLPNGRRLAYVRPRIEPDQRFGKEKLTYEGVEQGKNKWGRINTYGPKLVENIVQAIARDCLAYAMMELDREGYQIAMHVHDEVVIEGTAGDLRDVEEIMARVPPWAEGLPLRADGYECTYYRKD